MNRYRKNSLSLKDAITIWEAVERRMMSATHSSVKIQEQFEALSKHIFELTGEGLSNTLLRDSLYYPIKNKVPVIKISRRTLSIIKEYINEPDVISLIDILDNNQPESDVDRFNGKWDCYRWCCINNKRMISKSILELNNTHNHTFEALWNDAIKGLSKGWGKLSSNAMTIVIDNTQHPIMLMTDFNSLINNGIVNQLSGIIVSSQGYGQLATRIILIKNDDFQPGKPEIFDNIEEAKLKLKSKEIAIPEDSFLCNVSMLDTPPAKL